jgi:hypothetical protein
MSIDRSYDGGQPTAYGIAKQIAEALLNKDLTAAVHSNRAQVIACGEAQDGKTRAFKVDVKRIH